MKCHLVLLVLSVGAVKMLSFATNRRFLRKAQERRFASLDLIRQIEGDIRLEQCTTECGALQHCVAFNYASSLKNGVCQLSSTKAPLDDPSTMIKATEFNYYEDDYGFVPNQHLESNGDVIESSDAIENELATAQPTTIIEQDAATAQPTTTEPTTTKTQPTTVEPTTTTAPPIITLPPFEDDDMLDGEYKLESQCQKTVPNNYCNGRGMAMFSQSCELLDRCFCKRYFRGKNCEQTCSWRSYPGKVLRNENLNIGSITRSDHTRCLANCTKNVHCAAVQFYKAESLCFFKSAVIQNSIKNEVKTRTLYTISCVTF